MPPPLHLSPPYPLLSPSPLPPASPHLTSPTTFNAYIQTLNTPVCVLSHDCNFAFGVQGCNLIAWKISADSSTTPSISWTCNLQLPHSQSPSNSELINASHLNSLSRPPGLPTSLALSFDSKLLLLGTSTGLVFIIDALHGGIVTSVYHGSYSSTNTSADDNDNDDTANVTAGVSKQSITPYTITDLKFSHTHNTTGRPEYFVCCSEDGTASLHSLIGSKIAVFECNSDVLDTDLTDEKSGAYNEQNEWQANRGYMQPIAVNQAIRACGVTRDGQHVITGGESEMLDFWFIGDILKDSKSQSNKQQTVLVKTPNKRVTKHNSWINTITFPPYTTTKKADPIDGCEYFATADILGWVIIWRLDSNAEVESDDFLRVLWKNKCHVSMVTSVNFGAAELSAPLHILNIVTAGVDGKIAMWSVADFVIEGKEVMGDGRVIKQGISIDESEGRNKHVHHSQLLNLNGHAGGIKATCYRQLHSTPLILSAGTDQSLNLWVLPTNIKTTLHLPLHNRTPSSTLKRDAIKSIILSKDGTIMATIVRGGCEVRVWEVENGKLLIVLKGHQRSVRSFDFSIPEGEEEGGYRIKLVSGDEEGVVYLWSFGLQGPETEPEPEPASSSQFQLSDSFVHPSTSDLVSFHHHQVPIRSIRFCGSDTKSVSCDATGKVLIVFLSTLEIQTLLLGGGVSCNVWECFRGGGEGESEDVELVTASLDSIAIWNCSSGKIEGFKTVEGGCGDIQTFDTKGNDDSAAIVCCTDEGKVLYWLPMQQNNDLVDLTSMLSDNRKPFSGVRFGANGTITAWNSKQVFIWKRKSSGGYEYVKEVTAGEGAYGICHALVFGDEEGVLQVVLEDGWVYKCFYLM